VSDFISAKVDLGDFQRGIRAMRRRAALLGPVFRELRPALRRDQTEHARRQEGPQGKWPKRAASTMGRVDARASVRVTRRKDKKSGKRVTRRVKQTKPLGTLPRTVKAKAEADRVYAKSPVPWALAHQLGERVGRGVKLPARPFLWISDKLLRKAGELIEKRLADAWRKR
jgi:phage gpG-like protein